MVLSNKLICFFQPPMYGNGLDRCNLNMAKALSQAGFSVDLVVPEITEYHQRASESLPAAVRTISLGLSSSQKNLFLKKVIKLRQYLTQEKPDVLIAAGDYIGVSNLARAVAQTETKIVHLVQIHVSSYFERLLGFKTRIRSFLLKYFYRRSDGIIAVSKGTADDLSGNYGVPAEKIQIFYNPVDLSTVLVKAKEDLEHPWFLSEETPVIIGAGRLMYQKDFSTLIKAFAKVRQDRPCRLVILGEETGHKAELEALSCELGVGQDVQLLGYTYNPYAYMANASIFALSSRYEGLPNVLLEAMAVGTPVVSTNCESGPAEILADGHYGILVPVGDSEAMADAISKTLNQPISSHLLQERAQMFSVEKIAKQYFEYLDALTS